MANGGRADVEDKQLQAILGDFEYAFRAGLPLELSPKRTFDHEIVIYPDSKIPHRGLYQQSQNELHVTRDYIIASLNNKVIRTTKRPFGALLFFLKEPRKALWAVLDYRGLNRITKNITPISRPSEMYGQLGGSKLFTKMDLKARFHQNLIKPEDAEKTLFPKTYWQYEYMVMPMGLCSAPAEFLGMMNEVL